MSSKVRIGVFAGALGVALMAATSAFAVPTTVIGGIQVPTNFSPTGNYISGQLDFEHLVTASGQMFFGLGQVTDIADGFGNITYTGGAGLGINASFSLLRLVFGPLLAVLKSIPSRHPPHPQQARSRLPADF